VRLPAPLDGGAPQGESGPRTGNEVYVRVLFYGRLAETIGAELQIDEVSGCSIEVLRERLIVENPGAEQPLRSKRARACVGDSIVHDDYVLKASDTVEFMPPVSGG
jgi:molybdopterin converting factor small subunit